MRLIKNMIENGVFKLILSSFAIGLLAACSPDPEGREFEFMPDMYRNPAVKAQEYHEFFKNGNSNLMPPANTVPIGFEPYPYSIVEGEKAGEELENPLPLTRKNIELGQKYYNIHCIVCHGEVGAGDGLATLANRPNGMPIPAELYSEKIMNEWKDGQLYHTITLGQGQMPGYANRISQEHRWAIVHYIRALGIAANPSEIDLEVVEARGLDAKEEDKKNSTLRESKPEVMNEKLSVYRIDPLKYKED